MKRKLIPAILLGCILFLFTACGAPQAAPAPETAPPAVSEATPAPAASAEPGLVSTLPGSAQPTPAEPEATEAPVLDEAGMNAALACIGQDVSALYDAIGEPSDSSYASSGLGPGEDGELYYEGFYVATYREGEKEIVRDVIANVD